MNQEIDHLREQIGDASLPDVEVHTELIGVVEACQENMAVVAMGNVGMGSIVHFDSGLKGIVASLYKDKDDKPKARVLLLDGKAVRGGEAAHSRNEIFSVAGGWGLAGRVLNGIGNPIDEGRSFEKGERFPIIRGSPPYSVRQNVDTPLPTGCVAVDGLIPIGRGQRELIIGDRHTGKTAFAIDTIKHQRDKNTLCVYVAIGKKRQDTLRIIDSLRNNGSLEYTVVVMAPADAAPAEQVYAAFCGCAIGESVMYQGGDALIVYDDLTANAWAYRQASLIQQRSVGREAYPGDIFSLHATLLERAGRLADTLQIVRKGTNEPVSEVLYTGYLNTRQASRDLALRADAADCEIVIVKKGGSLTALPILQTEQGDFSAFVTTNVVSITDGQLYFDGNLFRANTRPAVDVGLSVSRVGGDAQRPGVKQFSGGLRADLAALKDLAAASKIGRSSLDSLTLKNLTHGEHLQAMLVQGESEPLSVAQQIALLYSGTHKTINFDAVPLANMAEFIAHYLDSLTFQHSPLMGELDKGGKVTPQQMAELDSALAEFLQSAELNNSK